MRDAEFQALLDTHPEEIPPDARVNVINNYMAYRGVPEGYRELGCGLHEGAACACTGLCHTLVRIEDK